MMRLLAIVVCFDCSQRVAYKFGTGKVSRWQSLTVACFLLLLVGCTRPKEQAKPTPLVSESHSFTFTRMTNEGEVETGRLFKVCRKNGESQYAGNTQFEVICWSNDDQRFTRLTLLEQ